MRISTLFLSLLCGFTAINASDGIKVKGRLIDAITLEPIPGGMVIVDATGNATIAGPDGVFIVTAPEESNIKFAASGYDTQVMKARHQFGNITMHSEISESNPDVEPTKEQINSWIEEGEKLYSEGHHKEAFDIFQRLLLEDHPVGHYFAGIAYVNGEGVYKDAFTGAMHMYQAADGGLVPAQYMMGVIYEEGIGFRRDIVKAREWYERAANSGDEDSRKALERLNAQ